MKWQLIIFFCLGLILAANSSIALTVNGQKLSPIIYEPGKTIINHYSIEDNAYPVEASVSGDLMEYIEITDIINNQFDLLINFPESYLQPGSYKFILHVGEIGNSTSGISSLLSVTKVFTIEVYSHEKELEASLSAQNVNQGEKVPFHVTVKSRSYADISFVQGAITIADSGNKVVGSVKTNIKTLPALSENVLEASFPTTGLPADKYHAWAAVSYDGKEKMTENASFRIGTMELTLKNYTSTFAPGFSEFSALVFNAWGSALQEVYLKLSANNKELLQTATTSIGPWEEKELKGIVKVELLPGNYPALLTLFFDDEIKEKNITITVTGTEEETLGGKTMLIIVALSIILLIIILGIFIWRFGKNNWHGKKKDGDI